MKSKLIAAFVAAGCVLVVSPAIALFAVIDCKNPKLVGRRLEVIAALWVYGTTPALDLVFKLRGCG
jgi:hypothetical protein